MNEQANAIIRGMQAMAKGQALATLSGDTSIIRWMGFRCCYYPGSNRFSWFQGTKNITRALDRRTLVSLINITLEQP